MKEEDTQVIHPPVELTEEERISSLQELWFAGRDPNRYIKVAVGAVALALAVQTFTVGIIFLVWKGMP